MPVVLLDISVFTYIFPYLQVDLSSVNHSHIQAIRTIDTL